MGEERANLIQGSLSSSFFSCSLTATPTPSPSNLCSLPTGPSGGQPLTSGSVLAIRIGDGRSSLQTSSFAREVSELPID